MNPSIPDVLVWEEVFRPLWIAIQIVSQNYTMNTPPLPKLLESKAYERAVTAWDGPRITIISPANKAIAHIPLNFVIQGGDNTWAYVIGVARQLVVEDDGWIFDGPQAVNSVDPPFAGTFVYSSQGKNVSSRSA